DVRQLTRSCDEAFARLARQIFRHGKFTPLTATGHSRGTDSAPRFMFNQSGGRMHQTESSIWRVKAACVASVFVWSLASMAAMSAKASPSTASPIEHVIIIVGENRSFDHLYATYVPKARGDMVMNLLSQGIVKADGSPGPNFAKGQQYSVISAPNAGKFFISAKSSQKQLSATLPAPDVGGVGATSPYAAILTIPGGDPGLPPQDQFLFATGGTGLSFTLGPDTRITNVTSLPPGPFQMTG